MKKITRSPRGRADLGETKNVIAKINWKMVGSSIEEGPSMPENDPENGCTSILTTAGIALCAVCVGSSDSSGPSAGSGGCRGSVGGGPGGSGGNSGIESSSSG